MRRDELRSPTAVLVALSECKCGPEAQVMEGRTTFLRMSFRKSCTKMVYKVATLGIKIK